MVQLEVDLVVDRPLTRSEARDRERRDREIQDVLVALAGPEDEEAVLAVVDDERHEHHARARAGRERREQTDDERGAGRELRAARQPCVQLAGLHAEALEPSPRAGDLPAAEHVVVTVRHHRSANCQPQQQQTEIHLVESHGRAQ